MRQLFLLELVDQLIVFSMRSDPKPEHMVALSLRQHTLLLANSRRIILSSCVKPLKIEARMIGIYLIELERFARQTLHIIRQSGKLLTKLLAGAIGP